MTSVPPQPRALAGALRRRLARTRDHRYLVADDATRVDFVTRVLAGAWLLGAVSAAPAIAVSDLPAESMDGLLSLDVLASAIAIAVLVRRGPFPALTFDAMLALGTAMLTGGLLIGAGNQLSAFGLYYVVIAALAFYGLPRRRAFLQFAFVAAGYGVLLGLRHQGDWASSWVGTVGIAAVAGWVLLTMREALQRSDARFMLGFEQSPIGISLVSLDGRFLRVNAALAEILGRSPDELTSMSVLDVAHPDERELTLAALEREPMHLEKRYVRPDGGVVWVSITPQLVRDRAGEPLYFYTQTQDVTERRARGQEARRGRERQAAIAALGHRALEGLEPGILIDEAVELAAEKLGADLAMVGEFVDVGDEEHLAVRAERGWPQELGGLRLLPSGRDSMSGYALETRAPVVVDDWALEKRIKPAKLVTAAGVVSGLAVLIESERERPFGTVSVAWREHHIPCTEEIDFLQAVANTLAAAIERAHAEDRIRHHALHDPLTGLANRALFMDRLATSLRRGREGEGSTAVLVLDADRFKSVNDNDGYAAGDQLLEAIGRRLASILDETATAARLGGDEFALLLEDVSAESDAVRAAEAVAAAFAQPVVAGSREHFVTFSSGVAVGRPGDDPEELVSGADAAMYRAKELGRARYEICDDAVRGRVVDRLRLENDLRRALERDELTVAYQPIVSLGDGRIVGAEALLRWTHPERGEVPPAEFVPLAEDCGLIHPLGRFVLENALGQAAQWQGEHPDRSPFAISVNLSPRQLSDPSAVRSIGEVLLATGVDRGAVSLEITETALMDDLEAPEETLAALKRLGVKVALDDFGTGYSSLGYLRRFRLDALKVDRSFVDELGSDRGATAIVRAIVGLAQALELEVVAEGVETSEQLEFLRELGCTYAQGFLLARPMPPARLGEMIDRDLRLVSGAATSCTSARAARS